MRCITLHVLVAIEYASTTMYPSDNLLLRVLPPGARRNLLSGEQPVLLERATAVAERGKRVRYVYFPLDSAVSLLTPLVDGDAALQVALVGNEGMVGAALLLGIDVAPQSAVVQGSGWAWRVDAKTFRRQIAASGPARAMLHRYLYVQLIQLAQTVACTRFHLVEARLARSLLMARDRAASCEFHVTQQLLAELLGVRRAGVTRAATALRHRKLIRYSRGELAITDELGLENAACGCYAADKRTYSDIVGEPAFRDA